MTTKHTAGPWKLSDSNRMDMHIRAGEKGFVIAEINSRTANFIGNQSEAEANAQLIATAPELLAALIEAQNLVNLCRQYMPKSIKNSDRFTFENTAANIIDKAIQTAVK